MRKNKFDVTVGKSVFNALERKVTSDESSFRVFAEEKASDLLLQSPYFVDVLRHRGLLKESEHHSKYIYVFRTNLACQRFGVMEDKAELLVTKYAGDRAKAIVEHLLRNKPEQMMEWKNRGISQYVAYYAFRDLFLKDSLQTDYIAGLTLRPETEITAGIAVNKRLIKTSPKYGEMLKLLNINPGDDTELRDVVRETEFRSLVVDHYKDEPFYALRSGTITAKKESITDGYADKAFDVEAATLFHGGNSNDTQNITEKVFVHLIDSLGLNRAKLVKMLVS